MKITRSFISAASALAIFAGTAAPALAYQESPHAPTTRLSLRGEDAKSYADVYASVLALNGNIRAVSNADTTGRSMLARAQVRSAQRNFNRHILGYLRGADYRILNTVGRNSSALPTALVQTGTNNAVNQGSWGYDRPTRRDIRDNQLFNQVDSRKRNVLAERAESLK